MQTSRLTLSSQCLSEDWQEVLPLRPHCPIHLGKAPLLNVLMYREFICIFEQDWLHLNFANGWQVTIGISLLQFFSCLKINHDQLVTAAFAQRNSSLWLQRETAEKEENKQNCKIWDFIWHENDFWKAFLTLNCFLSHLKATPVPHRQGRGAI